MKNFVHLHVHTQYSLLDGCARIKDIVQKAKDLGMPGLAITDHGVMYGALHFYKAAKAAGIKPIIGCEVYVARRGMLDKDVNYDKQPYHLILLAKNKKGYQNLCKLVSKAFLDGFYYKPRVDLDLLREYSEGLICLSACLAGALPRTLLKNVDEKGDLTIPEENIIAAKEVAKTYLEIFGEGNYYIELQNHHIPAQAAINPIMAQIAKELNVPLVATNDLHYTNREDSTAHDVLLCIQTGRLLSDPNRMRFETDDFYLKSREEMEEVLGEYPEALDNTLEIMDKCNFDFTFGELYLPVYEVPEGHDLNSYLRYLCEKGLHERYENITPELRERLEYELGIIKTMDFPGYFLIVWDIINFCHKSGIAVGPGRGSAAGSLVAYTLGITNIDPIRYKLIFERFLNPERVSMPDIDTDFHDVRRLEVVDYLVEKYGADKVGQIVTFGTLKAKGVIKDVGRAMDIPFSETNRIAKLIPDDPKITLDRALKESDELRQIYNTDQTIHQCIDYARKLEGLPRQPGTHAAGVVIARDAIDTYMPVQKIGDGIMSTQFEKDQVEEQGLLKMDLLGLKTLTVIDDSVKNIKKNQGIEINIDKISLEDKKTYDMLIAGDSDGVFQLESSGMKNILRKLQPNRIEDLVALVALYRPGPLGSGMVDDFIECKHGRKEVTYLHPLLEPILKETYGVMLYQEQIMQTASALAGFSLGQADVLRRIMGKKKPEYLPPEREKFLKGCAERNIDADVAGKIFDLMEYFSGYGFNKSHSAAYAVVTYQTAWLKRNYPVEYFAALMTSIMGTAEKVSAYMKVCKNMGIQILPPDINESFIDFTVVGKKIRFGLAAVKNVGEKAVQEIIDEREANGPFTSLLDLCERVSINRKTLESLIRCGSLDSLGHRRSQMLMVMEQALDMGKKCAQEKDNDQMSLFDLGCFEEEEEEWSLEMPDIPEYSNMEILAMEKEMMGFYISGHPLDDFVDVFKRKNALTLSNMDTNAIDSNVILGSMISNIKNVITKKGDNMAILTLEDGDKTMEAVVFPKAYEVCKNYLLPNAIVILTGKLDKKEEEPKLLVNKVVPARHFYIRFNSADDIYLTEKVTNILREYPGTFPVSYFFVDLNKYRDLGAGLNVALSREMVNRLDELLGKENVVVK